MGRCKTGKENEIDTRCGGRKARRRGRRAGARGKGGRWSIKCILAPRGRILIFVEVQSESKCARLTGKRPRLNQRLMSELLSPPGGTPGLGLIQTEKDLVSGSIGGIAQVLVGQVSQPISIP